MNHTLNHRWLVVDDDPCALELTAAILRSVPGSDVVACDNPQRALEVFFAAPESFELMVTDFDMPGLDGLALAHAVHERAPQLPVVMVTGSDLEGASARRGELRALLPKPFLPGALLAMVLTVVQVESLALRGESGSPLAARAEPPKICLV